MMTRLSEEQRLAIQSQPGSPIEIRDEATQRVYLLIPQDQFQRMVDEQLRVQLQLGFDQADAGDEDEWDVEEMLHEAHRRHDLKAPS